MAPLPIRYWLEAVNELDDAVAWFSHQSPSVANEFRQLVRTKIAEARRDPQHWPLQADGTRQIHLAPYQYLLIIREAERLLEIVAAAHTSRRPGYWRKRLS